MFIFFDGYASVLLAGETMRPLFEKPFTSPEKSSSSTPRRLGLPVSRSSPALPALKAGLSVNSLIALLSYRW
jgi:hypothetical protein